MILSGTHRRSNARKAKERCKWWTQRHVGDEDDDRGGRCQWLWSNVDGAGSAQRRRAAIKRHMTRACISAVQREKVLRGCRVPGIVFLFLLLTLMSSTR